MFWKEKHTGIFLAQICCIFALAAAAGLVLTEFRENRMRDMLFRHDAAIASFLLEQGMEKEVAARAVLSEKPLASGEQLLYQAGMSENTDIRFMPEVYRLCAAERTIVSLCGTLFFVLIFASVFRYLKKRDDIYRRAIDIVENYADNDFSVKLPELHDGTLYQLFSSINSMAAMLKTKHETENQVKEFLKNTISDISHQLKTPLAALSMYQEIMISEADRTETVIAFAKKSEAALMRMEGLIRSLLKLARLDAGNVFFSRKLFDASELVMQALEELEERAKKENKKIILSGEEKAKVWCDMEWSREALGNIVKNALDHTGEGDMITISWEQTPLMTRFTVKDTGEGIPEEDIHHIFKRFYRSKNSRPNQGIGLGLSLARSIVEGQGGAVSAESEKGKGSTFLVSFPG